MLNQEVDFEYELLIGEDGSTDGTREICIEYEKKYPDIIRLFLNNRDDVFYMHGSPTGRSNFVNNINNARGKYIAFCDGDDYWISTDKLKRQVVVFERENVDIVFHSVFYGSDKKTKRPNFVSKNEVKMSARSVIKGAGGLMPMASIMACTKKLKNNLDGIYIGSGAHFYVQAVCAIPNGAVWVPDVYSYYLVGSESSITQRTLSKRSTRQKWLGSALDLIVYLDQKFDGIYRPEFKEAAGKSLVFSSRSNGMFFRYYFPMFVKYKMLFGFSSFVNYWFWFFMNYSRVRPVFRSFKKYLIDKVN
jgi:glycosyltransferase involved in cell wall biosynthesis